MSAYQRTKGHNFERFVADAYRKRWPSRRVRRSQQGHKAHEPDVVVEDVALWTECQTSVEPTPLVKLEQAERDAAHCTELIHCVAVWRKTGARTIWATMRLGTLLATTFQTWTEEMPSTLVVTVDFVEWLRRTKI